MSARPAMSTAPSDGAKTQIQSVSRAVRLLFRVAERPDGASATESADCLGIPVPTAYHLLNTLVAEGMLAKDPRRRYVLGPRIGILNDAIARDLLVPHFLATPLRALADQTGETAYLTAWRRGQITVLASVEGARAVKVSGLYPGCCDHAHARASGKLLLAYATKAIREGYIDQHPLVAVTPRTIVDRVQFEHELEDIRRREIAIESEEFAEGVACVAAPAMEGTGLIAAYTVSAPRDRFEQQREQLTRSAVRIAQSVTTLARGGRLASV